MAKAKAPTNDPRKYDSRIVVSRSGRLTFAILLIIATVVFTVLIFNDLNAGKHWLRIGAPLICLGFLFLLCPPTEEWEYKPWQGVAQQVERYTNDG